MGLIQIAVLGFVAIVAVSHLAALAGYRWTRDTVSRLGLPDHRHGWILR